MKRWLFVLPWELEGIGGVSEVVRNLLVQSGSGGDYAPKLFICRWVGHRRRPDADPPEMLDAFGMREPAPSSIAFLAHAVPTLLAVRRLLEREAVDVVNVHYPGSSMAYFAVARRLGWMRRLVVSLHGHDLTSIRATTGFHRVVWRFIFSAADAVVACSDDLAEQARAVPDLIRPTIVSTVHNGVDVDRCEAELADEMARRPVAPSDDGTSLAAISTFEHKKGLDVLVDAFERLRRTRPDVRLTIVGRWTPWGDTLLAQIDELARRDPASAAAITLVRGEPHPAVLARLKTATMMVLPSRKEGFPLVMLEAGLVGAPIVAAAVSGIPELIRDGEHGLLVPTEDPEALAAAIARVIDDPEAARERAARLRTRVLDHFTWRAAWDRYRDRAA